MPFDRLALLVQRQLWFADHLSRSMNVSYHKHPALKRTGCFPPNPVILRPIRDSL
jgi:hypothetical protein